MSYIPSLIDGLQHLLRVDVQTPVNIGNPNERSILDLAEIIIELTDSDSAITHETLPSQDPQVRQPDIAKARSELGWEPDVSLRDGLRESIETLRFPEPRGAVCDRWFGPTHRSVRWQPPPAALERQH